MLEFPLISVVAQSPHSKEEVSLKSPHRETDSRQQCICRQPVISVTITVRSIRSISSFLQQSLVVQYRASIFGFRYYSSSLCSSLLLGRDFLVLDADFLFFDGVGGASSAHLLQLSVIWAVDVFVVFDDIVIGFEFGLEEVVACGHGGRVAATLGLGEVVWEVVELGVAWGAPVAASLTLLLGARWIDAVVAVLCKVAWQVLFWSSCAIGETDVVTVVGLLSASHVGWLMCLGEGLLR